MKVRRSERRDYHGISRGIIRVLAEGTEESFPWLEEEVGELSEKQRQLVSTLDMVRVEKFIPIVHSLRGRPSKKRSAIARAFVAKAVYNMPTTRDLLERLSFDRKLRRICGWGGKNEMLSESTFSKAFAEFCKSQLAQRVHEALIMRNLSDELIGHISRDSTEIEVRGKPEKKAKSEEEPNGKKQKEAWSSQKRRRTERRSHTIGAAKGHDLRGNAGGIGVNP